MTLADLALAVRCSRGEMLNQGGLDPQGLRYAAAGGQYQNFQALGVSVVHECSPASTPLCCSCFECFVTAFISSSKAAVDACRANRHLLYMAVEA